MTAYNEELVYILRVHSTPENKRNVLIEYYRRMENNPMYSIDFMKNLSMANKKFGYYDEAAIVDAEISRRVNGR